MLVYCYRCTNVGFINSSTSASPWIACKGAFIQDPPHANHRQLRLQWAHEHRALQADCTKLSFQLKYVREMLQPEVVSFL
ncbi:uncharacterized protein TNCV_1127501 [Trichonephila clavipes]|nr:uncharacterized protein TNCV_1127501 [Trichonephila clavipes]